MLEIIEVIARPRVTGQLLNVLDIVLLICSTLILCRVIKHCKEAENFLCENALDKEDMQIIQRKLHAMFFGCFCIAVAGVLLAMLGPAVKPDFVVKLSGYGTALMSATGCIITAREAYRVNHTGSAREEHKR